MAIMSSMVLGPFIMRLVCVCVYIMVEGIKYCVVLLNNALVGFK